MSSMGGGMSLGCTRGASSASSQLPRQTQTVHLNVFSIMADPLRIRLFSQLLPTKRDPLWSRTNAGPVARKWASRKKLGRERQRTAAPQALCLHGFHCDAEELAQGRVSLHLRDLAA